MPEGRVISIFGSFGAIAEELARRIAEEGSASPIQIVVPSRAAAEEVLRRASASLPSIGLELHSIETLARRIVNSTGRYPRIESDIERRLAMELACGTVRHEIASTPGITAMLLRSEQDVRDSGLVPEELARRIKKAARLPVKDRMQAVGRIWGVSRKILNGNGCDSLSSVIARATAALREGTDIPRQIIYGFYDATEIQAAMLSALVEGGHVEAVYVPVPFRDDGELPADFTFATRYSTWAKSVSKETKILESGQAQPSWTVASHASPLRELHETCRSVRSLLDEGVSPDEVAIVCRAVDLSEALLLDAVARRFGIPLRGLPGRPLSGNRIARGVIHLLRLQEGGMLRRDVMEIIRSGARLTNARLPSINALESATRRANIARGRKAEVLSAERRARWDSNEPNEVLLEYADLIDDLDRQTSEFIGERSGSAWSFTLEELLEAFRAETDEDLFVVDSIRDIARTLRREGFSSRRLDTRTVTSLIEAGPGLPSRVADGPAVWFGDIMRFRGRSVRHVFAIRIQHDSVPQRRIEDALLPDTDRRSLGVRQIGDGRDEERLLFTLLCDSATEAIHFSFASSDGLGRSLRPSSLVKDYAIERDPENRLEILQRFDSWIQDAPGPPGTAASRRESAARDRLDNRDPAFLRTLQLHELRGRDSAFDGRVTPSPAFRERLHKVLGRISPSRLEHLGECPHRFFMTSVLSMRETEDPEPNVQIEIREKGLIDHQILEDLYSSLTEEDWTRLRAVAGGSLPRVIRDRLTSVVNERFDKLEAEFPPLNKTIRSIERDETTNVLADFAASDLNDLTASGFRPSEFELMIDVAINEDATIAMGPLEAGIRGRIDRLDEHPDGRVRIVDYKSGKAMRQRRLSSKIDEGLRMQLVVYSLAVQAIRGIEPDSVSATILPLRLDASQTANYAFGLGERYERINEMLATLSAAINDGRFPAVPYSDVCNYCVVKDWCRTRHDPHERATATRHGPAVRLLEETLND